MRRNTLLKWMKTEKRIVRLMYRAGLLDNHFVKKQWIRGQGYVFVDPKDVFYWAYYHQLHEYVWNKSHKGMPPYMPEVHYCQTDYWGEADEYPVARHLEFELCSCEIIGDDGNWLPPCEHCKRASKSRYALIRELKRLPVKRNDHKINGVLKKKK